MARARRSKPTNGFPSKPLVGVQAARVQEIMLLMASGQWAGKITEIGLARKWDLSLAYVQDLADSASANLQITLTPTFQEQLRARLFHSTQALTSKLSQYVLDDDMHGDVYWQGSHDGTHWADIPEDRTADYKNVRRRGGVPFAALASMASTAFKGMEGVARLGGVELDPKYLAPSGGAGGESSPSKPTINLFYEGVTPPEKPGGDPPPAAPAAG